ncbi:hypothetical protein V2A60_000005 [Cordyceps javanica]
MSESPEYRLTKLSHHPALTYLPPGWTEEQYQNMTPEEQTALPEEQSKRLDQRALVEVNIAAVKHMVEINKRRAARGAPPLPLRPELAQDLDFDPPLEEPPVDQSVIDNGYIIDCVYEMEDLALDDYGFNILRTYYGDEQLWETFQEGFHEKMQRGIAEAPLECSEAMQRLDDNILTRISQNPEFIDKGPADVSQAFQIFFLQPDDPEDIDPEEDTQTDQDEQWSDEIGPGIVTSMCLMVDRPSMESIVGDASYVIAVDARLHTGNDLGYRGYFKVAINALMPKFYAALHRYELVDIAAAVDIDGIWRGMGTFNADREFEYIEKLIS